MKWRLKFAVNPSSVASTSLNVKMARGKLVQNANLWGRPCHLIIPGERKGYTHLPLIVFNGFVNDQVQRITKSFSIFCVRLQRVNEASGKLLYGICQFFPFFHIGPVLKRLVLEISTHLPLYNHIQKEMNNSLG